MDDLRLEPLVPSHAPGLFAALSDPAVHTFLDDGPPASIEALAAHIDRLNAGPGDASEVWLNWAVFLADRIVGQVQATIDPPGTASIAFLFAPDVWGQGKAYRASRAMIALLRDTHGIRHLVADTETGNLRSQRLLARLGFTETRREGRDIFYETAVPEAH
jgi:RimJ/RimL family protein N-acetyltransferase